MKILITGGAGFIGSALIREIINNSEYHIINVDKLTYAGNEDSLSSINNNPRYIFEKVDILNESEINRILNQYQPDLVMHLAAESHVDRSIDGPSDFIQTNIVGTYTLLEQARNYWSKLKGEKKNKFRFHHVSTDEVYGDLQETDDLFNEDSLYRPSSPYSASKASSDHLVRAWHRTYGLPIVISNCSNNYGPYQFPEKLIPLMILNAVDGKNLPIYGNGKNIRDWLYVDDHARALLEVAINGSTGETYNIGGNNEIQNIDVVYTICKILDNTITNKPIGIQKFEELITFVDDRFGHDFRYAIDASKIFNKLGWKPKETFESGITKTIMWYLDNESWYKNIHDGTYQRQRLGNNI